VPADLTPAGTGRHSILDLAPLELDCMNALWPSGEATVRQIQEALQPTRPRAYTTIMTILDRLAQKGIVERRKSGRAWVYRANMSADQARSHAVAQVVEGFFGGSPGALAAHLSAQGPAGAEWQFAPVRLAPPPEQPAPREDAGDRPRARAARAAAAAAGAPSPAAETPGPASEDLDTALL
jgi:BlaI family penicillinase repressor